MPAPESPIGIALRLKLIPDIDLVLEGGRLRQVRIVGRAYPDY